MIAMTGGKVEISRLIGCKLDRQVYLAYQFCVYSAAKSRKRNNNKDDDYDDVGLSRLAVQKVSKQGVK